MSSEGFSSDVLIIRNENSLPDGWKLISDQEGELSLNDRQRKEMIVFDVSREDSAKTIWILTVKSAYQGVMFMQLTKRAQMLGYKILKDGIIDSALLSTLYARKNNVEAQQKNKNNSAIILEFEKIIGDALDDRVSDVHILVRPDGTYIKMRKNGELQSYGDEIRRQEDGENLCSVMYTVLANTKSTNFDARLFQQAAIDYTIGDQDLKLRYQSLPAYPDGFDVVLRLLPIGRSEEFTPLVKLGYTEQQNEDLWKIGSSPIGALIIAGVTGSGKSTTSKNLLMSINAEAGYKIKCYTIEDPPEYNIARVTQIPVVAAPDNLMDSGAKRASPFEMPIKACMRADPDIIMIGEVRDHVTGDLTKKAVQSGHQVITTVHATSAIGIVERFIDFGLSRSVLGSPDFLSGLIYQKLLGVVCPHCSFSLSDLVKSPNVSAKETGIYKRISKHVNPEKFNIRVRNHKGCSSCSGGLVGRTVCAEIIVVDYNIIKLIATKDSVDLIRYWRGLSDNNPASTNMRGKTCMEHAFQKMLMGTCCPFEVEGAFSSMENMKMVDMDVEEMLKKPKGKPEEVEETKEDVIPELDLGTDTGGLDVDSEDFTLDEK